MIFSTLAAGLVVYLIASSQMAWAKIPSVLATTANVFGILLVVVFLGHGLVSLPKQTLLLSDYRRLVEHQYRSAELVDTRRGDTAFDVEVEYRKTRAIRERTADALLQSYCDTVLRLVPEEVARQAGRDPRAFEREEELRDPTEDKLAAIHRVVKRKVSELRMYTSWMDNIVEAVEACNSSVAKNQYALKRWGFRTAFVAATALSLLVFLAELSTFVPAVTVVNVPFQINGVRVPALVYCLNTALLLYVVYVVSHAVFEMKVFGLYSLHPRHSTAASLLFASVNLSRVSYPICYNYLQLTGLPRTAFLSFFGEVNLGEADAFIFPVLLLAFALFNVFDLYDRVMTCFGLGNYAFTQDEKEDTRREGKRVVEEWTRARSPAPAAKPSSGYMELAGI